MTIQSKTPDHISFIISEELTLFNYEANSSTAVINDLAKLFNQHDYVYESYLDEVLKREKNMPTGLVTKSGSIAIPHTDVEHVKQSAIAIARMKSPVKFHNMANPTEQVDVDVVFLLAIANKELVNPFLGKMAELLQDEPVFNQLLSIDNAKEFIDLFISILANHKSM